MKDSALISNALAALDADGLRTIVREILPWLDEAARARLVNTLIDRAARGASGWTPPGPSAKLVAHVQVFAAAARRRGQANAQEVDDYLRQATHAFLSRHYPAAFAIFRALLLPAAHGEIDLGQHEMLDEVLRVDIADCAAQYVVSTYMTSAPAKRAQAVLAAIDDVRTDGHFMRPVQEMERVAVEALPGLSEFLREWRDIVASLASKERKSDWESDTDRWLSEVVQRLEGLDGLARLARKTRQAHDLRAWCGALLEARDWTAALAACEEAATLSPSTVGVRAELLDGAALSAQELGRPGQPDRLERAWRVGPTLLRLCRWLGTAKTKAVLARNATGALKACPDEASRQRALLHILLHDLEAAAQLLAAAPGLGWSREAHPGHLVFGLLARRLAPEGVSLPFDLPSLAALASDSLELAVVDEIPGAPHRPRLTSPDLAAILELADVTRPKVSAATRAVLLKALRRAAEKRVAGVAEEKRRRHYGHAARLVAACAVADPTPETATWVAAVRANYRRYSALHGEFDLSLKGR